MKKNITFTYPFLIFSFLSIIVLLRLSFTLIIFYWNVPQTDDFCFMAKIHDYGTFGSVKWWYLNWQGRFLPQLLTNLTLLQYQKLDNMLLYGILLIYLFCFSFYKCIYNLLVHFNYKLSISDKFIMSVFSVAIFCLLLDFHMDTSTLYWINVSTMYFFGVIFLLLGLSELLNPLNGFLSYLILIFSFLYVGCSSEHVSLLVIGLLLMFYFFQKFIPKYFSKYFNQKKLFWAIISCLFSFFIMYAAPGNSVRLSSIQHPSLLKGLRNIPKFINILYFNRLSLNFGYLILTFFFSFAFGSYFSQNLKICQTQIKKILIIIFAILLYVTIGTIIIFSFLLDYKGSTRAFVHVSLAITLFLVFVGSVFGLFVSPLQKPYVNLFCFFLVFIYASTIFYKFKFNLRPTLKYEKSVRQRLYKVKVMAKGGITFLIVPKLVQSQKNILLDGELASSKEDSTLIIFNKCLNASFGLKDKPIILVESD